MKKETDFEATWTRRELIVRVSTMLGGATLVGQAAMLAGCADDSDLPGDGEPTDGIFTAEDVELLDDIAETILPETDTPGARAAGVGAFIAVMVNDSYSPSEQDVFLAGLESLQADSEAEYGRVFGALEPAERLALAERLDQEQHAAAENGEPTHYFRMLKELTVLGFFSSEIAYADVLEYAETPGRFEPCRQLDADVRMMAGHAASLSSN